MVGATSRATMVRICTYIPSWLSHFKLVSTPLNIDPTGSFRGLADSLKDTFHERIALQIHGSGGLPALSADGCIAAVPTIAVSLINPIFEALVTPWTGAAPTPNFCSAAQPPYPGVHPGRHAIPSSAVENLVSCEGSGPKRITTYTSHQAM